MPAGLCALIQEKHLTKELKVKENEYSLNKAWLPNYCISIFIVAPWGNLTLFYWKGNQG